jgi:predicted nucleotidyltransferase component of viral defense system
MNPGVAPFSPAVTAMLERYRPVTARDYEDALKEIIQEIALLGLWRAKFFEHAAFYGGTALRILYGLDRFSEDLDFSLLKPQPGFRLEPYLGAIKAELASLGIAVKVEARDKRVETAIDSAFIKAGTREHLLRIPVPDALSSRVHLDSILKVKLDVDTDPPGDFETEAKVLLQPIPFAVNTFQQPDLFAGKLHAILHRGWKTRVKGRDYYDVVWYLARGTKVRLAHLEARLRQTGGWSGERQLGLAELKGLLSARFAKVDFEAAKKDVLPYLRDADAVTLWSREFFEGLLARVDGT